MKSDRRSKNCRPKASEGKKSRNGNRQGLPSRSITPRSGKNCKIIFQNFIFAISKAAWQKAEVFFCAGAGMLTVQKSVKGGRTMQVRSFLLTLGLGMAAGGTVVRRAPGGAEGRRCCGADHHGCGAETEALTARCCGGPPQHFFSRRAAGLAGTEKPCYNYGRISAKRPAANFRQQVCSLSQRSFWTFSPSCLQKCKIEYYFAFLPLRRVKERERTP